MESGALGTVFEDGDIIVKQGDSGDCMYVIQEGKVRIFIEKEDQSTLITELKEGDFFGEMAIFEKEVRSATVCSFGKSRLITVDKKNFLRRIHADPALVFRMVKIMSHRLRELNEKFAKLKATS